MCFLAHLQLNGYFAFFFVMARITCYLCSETAPELANWYPRLHIKGTLIRYSKPNNLVSLSLCSGGLLPSLVKFEAQSCFRATWLSSSLVTTLVTVNGICDIIPCLFLDSSFPTPPFCNKHIFRKPRSLTPQHHRSSETTYTCLTQICTNEPLKYKYS